MTLLMRSPTTKTERRGPGHVQKARRRAGRAQQRRVELAARRGNSPAVPVDDKLFEVAVEAGADDVVGDFVFADPALSASIRDALDAGVRGQRGRMDARTASTRPRACASARSDAQRRRRRGTTPNGGGDRRPLARRTRRVHLLEAAHRRHVAPLLGLAAEVP